MNAVAGRSNSGKKPILGLLAVFLIIVNLRSQFDFVKSQNSTPSIQNVTSRAELSNPDSDDIDQMSKKVSKAEAELASMSETIKTLQTDKEDLMDLLNIYKEEEQRRANRTESKSDELESLPRTEPNSLFEPHEICSYFPTQPFTASTFWLDHLSKIFDASKNPLTPELLTEENDAIMHNLLEKKFLPSRLRRAASYMPAFTPSSLKNVVKIVERRVQDPKNNPPLRIAVFGGSVTIGRLCRKDGREDLDCAWPKRLELLINQFVGMELVKVYNLGIGGTGSTVGYNMVKYWMYPDELAKVGPDVIINSYSTNDSNPPWNIKPEDDHVTVVSDQIRELLQDFIRAAMQSRGCDVQPLVVTVDDFLGPWQDSLLGDLSYSTILTQLSKWYDTVAISYGDVVRDIAWVENDERFFNKKDVHNGYWAHQAMAWSVGFASLELLSNYCDDEYVARKSKQNQDGGNSSAASAADNGEIEKNRLFLPPPLTRDLILLNATEEFNAALDTARQAHSQLNCSSADIGNDKRNEQDGDIDKNPCIISWISSPGGYDTKLIERFMKKYQTVSNGWQTEQSNVEGWTNKIGWIATQQRAMFQLKFPNVAKDVGMVTIFFLRSYGEKWKDSLAKFRISSGDVTGDGGTGDTDRALAEFEISGFHNDTTSLTLSETIHLSEIVTKGETLNIQVDLLSGNTFKLMGIMICKEVL